MGHYGGSMKHLLVAACLLACGPPGPEPEPPKEPLIEAVGERTLRRAHILAPERTAPTYASQMCEPAPGWTLAFTPLQPLAQGPGCLAPEGAPAHKKATLGQGTVAQCHTRLPHTLLRRGK